VALHLDESSMPISEFRFNSGERVQVDKIDTAVKARDFTPGLDSSFG